MQARDGGNEKNKKANYVRSETGVVSWSPKLGDGVNGPLVTVRQMSLRKAFFPFQAGPFGSRALWLFFALSSHRFNMIARRMDGWTGGQMGKQTDP